MISNTARLWAVERNETKNKEIRYKNAYRHHKTMGWHDKESGVFLLFLLPLMNRGDKKFESNDAAWCQSEAWLEVDDELISMLIWICDSIRCNMNQVECPALQPLLKLQNNPNPHWLQYCKQIHLYIQIRFVILRYRPTRVQAPRAALGSDLAGRLGGRQRPEA